MITRRGGLVRDASIQQRRQFLNLPHMIGQRGLHGGRNAERRMDFAEGVVREAERDRVAVVLDGCQFEDL
jgi:hypothetical protein